MNLVKLTALADFAPGGECGYLSPADPVDPDEYKEKGLALPADTTETVPA